MLEFFKDFFRHSSPRTLAINTWDFKEAAETAYETLKAGGTVLDAVVEGCTKCEKAGHASVGPGGHFDENGEITLDAMVMDGESMRAGAVCGLHRIAECTRVAKAVMDYTKHTMLVGEDATQFAKEMGFKETDLHSKQSIAEYKKWKSDNCQPNYRKNVKPDPDVSCGPYSPVELTTSDKSSGSATANTGDHDTVGLLAIDSNSKIAAACSTNGRKYKVPGRVGDSPVIGSGAYADGRVGAAAATGDGDHMMRFVPSYQTVEFMRSGYSPSAAAAKTMERLIEVDRDFSGAIIALNKKGEFGAACHGMNKFPFCVSTDGKTEVHEISCM